MVSVRLVDRPDSPEEYLVGSIPEMMFAAGEEPVGVRVITYLSSGAINRIYEALEDDEVQIIRRSSFGKILEIAEKPVFSGRFAKYILSRQMKTKKNTKLGSVLPVNQFVFHLENSQSSPDFHAGNFL